MDAGVVCLCQLKSHAKRDAERQGVASLMQMIARVLQKYAGMEPPSSRSLNMVLIGISG